MNNLKKISIILFLLLTHFAKTEDPQNIQGDIKANIALDSSIWALEERIQILENLILENTILLQKSINLLLEIQANLKQKPQKIIQKNEEDDMVFQ